MEYAEGSWTLLTPEYENDKIYLYQWAGNDRMLSASPYCTKLQFFLQLAELPHQVINVAQGGPIGKNPFIEVNGKVIYDSANIIEYLTKTYALKLDEALSPEQRATSRAFQRLLEEHLNFLLGYVLFCTDSGFEETTNMFDQIMPPVVRYFVPRFIIRPKVQRNLQGQGIGLMSDGIRNRRVEQDLEALSLYLNEKPYFMGTEPTSIDSSLFGFLDRILALQFDNPLSQHFAKFPNLKAYHERIKTKYFPQEKDEPDVTSTPTE